jgi:undecaprenyl diphosphate synthase
MEKGVNNDKLAASNCASQSEKPGGLHVAIIMDGNGRWASRRGLPRMAGHRAGVAAVRRVVERAPLAGITLLTLYAFSSDNWKRPAFEVRSALALIAAYPRWEREALREADARVEAIGRRDRLPRMLLREIEQCEAATGRRLHPRVAVDYSSREARIRLNPTAPRTSSSPSPAAPACTSSGSSRT